MGEILKKKNTFSVKFKFLYGYSSGLIRYNTTKIKIKKEIPKLTTLNIQQIENNVDKYLFILDRISSVHSILYARAGGKYNSHHVQKFPFYDNPFYF